ncbi:MAG: hypothetical protein ACUVX8_03100 [Candidatus Zipacnadales bacterium]
MRVESIDGTLAFVKDFSVCGCWFRWLVGRWLVGRECRIYESAAGLPGIPRFVARLNPYAIAVEHVGQSIPLLAPEDLPTNLWENLERIVDALHERGIAHGDLKTLENIVVNADGSVYLVDLNSAITRKTLIHRLIYPYISADDRRAIIKAKLELQPEIVTEEERAFFNQRPLAERIFRCLREPVRRFAKRLGGKGPAPGSGRPSVQRKRGKI